MQMHKLEIPLTNVPDLGILFIHGIGSQRRGETLVSWGDSLVTWIKEWTAHDQHSEDSEVQLCDTTLASEEDRSAPPNTFFTVPTTAADCHRQSQWLLAESWWADTFLPPSYRELLEWSFRVLPWATASHFTLRIPKTWLLLKAGAEEFSTTDKTTYRIALTIVINILKAILLTFSAMAVLPFILMTLAIMLLLGLAPIPQLRSLAYSVQRFLAASVGDSLVLLGSPMRESAILARVRRDLEWLSLRCTKVAVIAHSQGAAIAYEVLKNTTHANIKLLITIGSGIRKLNETRRLMNTQQRSKLVPWLLSAGAIIFFVGAWFSFPALLKFGSTLLLACVGYVATIVTLLSLRKINDVLLTLVRNRVLTALIILLLFVIAAIGLLISIGALLYIEIKWLDTPMSSSTLIGLCIAFMGLREAVQKRVEGSFDLPRRIRWIDLHSSKDPVSNGALFGHRFRRAYSIEICNLRSVLRDHTYYWSNFDGFVGIVACRLAGLIGLKIRNSTAGDHARMSRALKRRRWRVACLSALRWTLLLSIALIVTVQGVPSSLRDVYPGLGDIVANGTELVDSLTPVFIQEWAKGPTLASLKLIVPTTVTPAKISSLPGVVQAVSLITLFAVGGLIYFLMFQLWRVWDRYEVEQLFRRRDYELFNPIFVAFTILLLAIAEIAYLMAVGWLKILTQVSTDMQLQVLKHVLAVVLLGTIFYYFQLMWRFFWTSVKNSWSTNLELVLAPLKKSLIVASMGALAEMFMACYMIASAHKKGNSTPDLSYSILPVLALIWLGGLLSKIERWRKSGIYTEARTYVRRWTSAGPLSKKTACSKCAKP